MTTPPFEERSQAYWDSLGQVPKGRFATYSQALHEDIVLKALDTPMQVDGIAATFGVPRMEFYEWAAKGKTGVEPYRTLVADLVVASSRSEEKLVQRMANSPDWKASLALLKAQRPEVYADGKQVVSLSDATLDISLLSPGERETLKSLLSKMGNRVDSALLALPEKKK